MALVLLAVACASGGPAPSPTPEPSPQPSATPDVELSQAQLKYALLARFGPISWCDPDYYPIAHQDEQVLANQKLPEIQADHETYSAILSHLGIGPADALGDVQKLAIYRDWKLLNAVRFSPTGNGTFGFDLISETNVGLGKGVHRVGTIDPTGVIEVALEEDSNLAACPICLARGTLIGTPDGAVRVENLKAGDLVWTVDAAGRRVAAPLLRVGSTPVPATHQVVHLVLSDRREVWVSPGHGLPDGRTMGDLRRGDLLDGVRVVSADLVAYAGGSTFDILPAGSTGFYWANGILLASTLT